MPRVPYEAAEFIEMLGNAAAPYEQYKADLAALFEQYKSELAQLIAGASLPFAVTATLAADGWDSDAKTQTVAVAGVLASETAQLILPTPTLADQAAYIEAGILATGQGADSLTFTAEEVPGVDLTVHVAVIPLSGVSP